MQMATSVILHPNEILPTPLVLPHFLRLIVNVDDLSDHMLTVRLEVAALESPIRSMVKIIMFVVRKSAERRLLPVPVEATYVMRRLGSGQQGIPAQQATDDQRYLRQQQGFLREQQQESE